MTPGKGVLLATIKALEEGEFPHCDEGTEGHDELPE